MTRPPPRTPPGANLEHLRKQAKRLLKRYQQGDPHAIARIKQVVPRLKHLDGVQAKLTRIKLAEAQLAIARENGFENWAAIKQSFDKSQQPNETPNTNHESRPTMSNNLKLN